MIRLKMPKIAIFYKLVIVLLLVIAPLYGISMYLNQMGESSVRSEISNSMQSRVHFYIQSLVVELDRIQRLQREFINDDDLQKLSVASPIMSDLERTEAMIRLQKRLLLVKNSSNYIASANVFVPSLGKVINSLNMYTTASQSELAPLIDESKLHLSLVPHANGLYIAQQYPDRPEPDSIVFFLYLELSKQAIQQELKQFIAYNEEQAILFGSGFEWAITTDGNVERTEALQSIAESSSDGSSKPEMKAFSYANKRYIMTLEHSSVVDMTLLIYTPEKNALGPIQQYNTWFWVLSLSSVLIVIVFSYWLYRMIHRPLKQLVRSFRKVEKGNLDVKLTLNSNDEFEYLYMQFNSMLSQLKILIEEVYEEKIHSQKAELKQLQAQINPHFLYNTFFILNRMVKLEDYPKLKPFTKHLGNYFKFITRNASDDVPLSEELEFARAYLEIQKIRFEDRIAVEVDELPDDMAGVLVPRLTLQPIIENSYKYGLEEVDGNGRLSIRFLYAASASQLVIEIEDNGKGLSDEELWNLNRKLSDPPAHIESTGIINVHKRLRLKYGPGSGIKASTDGKLGGLKISLYIPVKEKDE
ncbi:HAMP domain-containing protein [Paenibacillus rhizovicinus]|uniref:HAMP domain-containing protein n=1 Tax=Paenibacillus rhizovicinus TaxID=2704463 RepID=A0A6C0NXS0_9BACL|nr:histidine kinase [Paenibacillus rhizovicinus]QHW30941.1 HAMP domain-containing protein [Paenibacillus rhizovicinus]